MKGIRNILVVCGLVAVGLFAYNATFNEHQPPEVDAELVKYVETWKQDCSAHDIELDRKWHKLDYIEYREPQSGKAGQYWEKERTVVIKPGLGHYQTLSLVYHELGHAVFNLKHDEGTLMDCELQSESFYKQNWNSLTTQYFRRIKGL